MGGIDAQMWTLVATDVVVGAAVTYFLCRKFHKVGASVASRIDKLETRLGDELAATQSEVRAETRAGFAAVDQRFVEVDQRLMTSEQRTCDLSTRLPPGSAATGAHESVS